MQYQSWGKYPHVEQEVVKLHWSSELPELNSGKTYLPFGLGRSYGDSCLNDQGVVLVTEDMNNLISFDSDTGVLTAEAGISLEDILKFSLPRGWFLPVTPGTKFVTLGGAIANDIHGKNHHVAGTFGCFVGELKLLRSNGEILTCSSEENQDLFNATIGGLGLTGLIVSASLRMKPVAGPLIDQETVKFGSLDEFYEVSAESGDYEYTVAWLDCVSKGDNFGRGIFIRGNHSEQKTDKYFPKKLPLSVPFNFPTGTLNKYTVKMFNFLYYNKQFSKHKKSTVLYDPFFYPLDSVDSWNRIYGKDGLLQFQCVIPHEKAKEEMKKLLGMVVDSGKASFLAVFKEFGDIKSPGMLSFPRPGATLCLDFPNSAKTRKLLLEMDKVVLESGGVSYPAKDALISKESFQTYYPNWKEFTQYKDPAFDSSFWRRVT